MASRVDGDPTTGGSRFAVTDDGFNRRALSWSAQGRRQTLR